MATTQSLTLFLFSLMVTTVICQTFQYSHGWTNGKRSMVSMEEIMDSVSKNADQLNNVLVNCELQKVKLLLQRNLNNPLLQLPCELFAYSKRSFPETMTNDHFRRQPASTNNNF